MKYIYIFFFVFISKLCLNAQIDIKLRINAIEPRAYNPVEDKVTHYGKSPLNATLHLTDDFIIFINHDRNATIKYKIYAVDKDDEANYMISTKELRKGKEVEAVWILYNSNYVEVYTVIVNIPTITIYYLD